MTSFDAILLGITQGLTEFLPVSSSGHLVFFQKVLHIQDHLLAFDIVVHWGTLTALIIYYFKDLVRIGKETFLLCLALIQRKNVKEVAGDYPFAFVGLYIVIGTIATVAVALLLNDFFRGLFNWLPGVGIAWVTIGILLAVSSKFQHGVRSIFEMNHRDAFVIGIIQGMAIIPGVSRSGATILTGMMMGLERRTAARFSFLMSIPVVIAAGISEFQSGVDFFKADPTALIIGFFTAALVGYFAIIFLIRLLQEGKFHYFGFYCIFMGVLALVYSFLTNAF